MRNDQEDKMSRFLIYVLRSQKLPCYLGLQEAPCSPLAAMLALERNKVLLGFHKDHSFDLRVKSGGLCQLKVFPPSSQLCVDKAARSLLEASLSLIEHVLPAQVRLS